jgi:hypothetical protein
MGNRGIAEDTFQPLKTGKIDYWTKDFSLNASRNRSPVLIIATALVLNEMVLVIVIEEATQIEYKYLRRLTTSLGCATNSRLAILFLMRVLFLMPGLPRPKPEWAGTTSAGGETTG